MPPLGLDSFTIAAALGTARTTVGQRLRVSALFAGFEAGMPLIGLAVGAPLAHLVGSSAGYVAGAVLILVGAWMPFSDEDDEEQAVGRLLSARGLAVLALGLSISLDVLAIGFTLGLAHLPVVAVVVAIGAQALIASHLGLAVGAGWVRCGGNGPNAWPGRCWPSWARC